MSEIPKIEYLMRIKNQLTCVKNRYNMMLNDTIEYYYINVINQDINRYLRKDGRPIYKKCYIIGVSSLVSFVIENDIKLATNYVLALGDDNKWNIFFGCTPNMNHEGMPHMRKYIDNFNNNNYKQLMLNQVINIIENSRCLFDHSLVNYSTLQFLHKIDEPCLDIQIEFKNNKIYFQSIVEDDIKIFINTHFKNNIINWYKSKNLNKLHH